MTTIAERTSWNDFKEQRPLSDEGRVAYEDEARISAFRAQPLAVALPNVEHYASISIGRGLPMGETTLRFGTWNMARRNDGWTSALKLAQEERLQVLLLQEATRPTSVPGEWRIHPGSDDWKTEGRPFTSAVVCCDSALAFSPVPACRLGSGTGSDGQLVTSHPGTFAAATIGASDQQALVMISAYGLMESGSSHTTLHRLLSDLELLLRSPQGQRTIIAGDLNSGDQPYDWSTEFHAPVWQRIALLRLQNLLADSAMGPLEGCSCDRGDQCRHVRTQRFRGGSKNAWQADYVLTMPEIKPVECRALNTVADESWPSDHCPVVTEVTL